MSHPRTRRSSALFPRSGLVLSLCSLLLVCLLSACSLGGGSTGTAATTRVRVLLRNKEIRALRRPRHPSRAHVPRRQWSVRRLAYSSLHRRWQVSIALLLAMVSPVSTRMQRLLKHKRLSSAFTAALPQVRPLTRRKSSRISNPSVDWATRLCSIPRDAIYTS